MTRTEFELLLFIDVADRAAVEPAPPPGKPKYYRRPWLELRDEMVACGAKTVAELPAKRIAVFYESTKPGNGGVKNIIKGIFGVVASD